MTETALADAPRYRSDMQQNEREFGQFIGLMSEFGVRSYLEIGSKWGGSLWRAVTSLPAGSTFVSIDLPQTARDASDLDHCIRELRDMGYQGSSYRGSSRDRAAAFVARLHASRLEERRFGAALIDGDHTWTGVSADWETYGQMAKIVAFHDISWKPRGHTVIDVPAFWDYVRAGRRHIEIRLQEGHNGIGIIINGD